MASFPSVPPTLSTEAPETRGYYETQPLPERNNIHSLEDLSPYLGLRARLSQVWLNKWTILILLVLARVLLLIGNLHDDIDRAEAKALSACTDVEVMGSTMASMPHYLAQGTNELAAKGITKTVDGLEDILFMALTAVEQIFLFVINMMYGTYECLITFAVVGAVHEATALLEEASKHVVDAVDAVTADLNSTVSNFEGNLTNFLKGISSIGSVFGGSAANIPALNVQSQITALTTATQFPGNFSDALIQLNSSVPSFDQVHQFTNQVLSLPFEEVRTLLNNTLGNYTFDQSVFQTPAKQNLDFCTADANSGITDFFNSLYTVADIARKIFIAVLLLAAIIACIPFAMLEIRRWRKMNERAKLIRTGNHEPLDVIYIVSRPVTAGLGMTAAQRFGSPKRQVLMRWFFAYITSTPALLVLAIALAGLFSCLCQYILLKSIEKEVPALAAEVGQFADKVVDALNDASTAWANQTNTAIIAEQARLNNEIFGWVNTTTTALNNTLDTFINETTNAINSVFGGGPLADPVKDVFACLIGLKVAAVQQGLTWAQDNAHISFPLFPNDVFSAGASKALAADNNSTGTNANGDSFLAAPGSDATDAITGAVVDLTQKLSSGIQQEALIALGVLLCYIIVVIIGACWTLFRCCSSRSTLRGTGAVTYAGDFQPETDSIQLQKMDTGIPDRKIIVAAHQPKIHPTATGLVYDWARKSDELVDSPPRTRTSPSPAMKIPPVPRIAPAVRMPQSQGVIGAENHDDPFGDEKKI